MKLTVWRRKRKSSARDAAVMSCPAMRMRSLGRRVEGADHVEQRGLAAPGGTENDREFPRLDAERRPLQRGHGELADLVAPGDVLKLYQRASDRLRRGDRGPPGAEGTGHSSLLDFPLRGISRGRVRSSATVRINVAVHALLGRAAKGLEDRLDLERFAHRLSNGTRHSARSKPCVELCVQLPTSSPTEPTSARLSAP